MPPTATRARAIMAADDAMRARVTCLARRVDTTAHRGAAAVGMVAAQEQGWSWYVNARTVGGERTARDCVQLGACAFPGRLFGAVRGHSRAGKACLTQAIAHLVRPGRTPRGWGLHRTTGACNAGRAHTCRSAALQTRALVCFAVQGLTRRAWA